MARKLSLGSMSVDELLDLRDQLAKMLAQKVAGLQQQIAKLSGSSIIVGAGASRGRAGDHALKGRKVAPKYRSKEDKKLTWSGRGATPRRMVAEMKSSKMKKEDFLIK
jgi:DNA-binding protein H-NS